MLQWMWMNLIKYSAYITVSATVTITELAEGTAEGWVGLSNPDSVKNKHSLQLTAKPKNQSRLVSCQYCNLIEPS